MNRKGKLVVRFAQPVSDRAAKVMRRWKPHPRFQVAPVTTSESGAFTIVIASASLYLNAVECFLLNRFIVSAPLKNTFIEGAVLPLIALSSFLEPDLFISIAFIQTTQAQSLAGTGQEEKNGI